MSSAPPSLGGVVQRQSGLYVPAGAVERTILSSDFMKLKRMMAFARLHLMEARFFCRECKEPIALEQEDRLVQGVGGKAAGGRFVLQCGCSIWRILDADRPQRVR